MGNKLACSSSKKRKVANLAPSESSSNLKESKQIDGQVQNLNIGQVETLVPIKSNHAYAYLLLVWKKL